VVRQEKTTSSISFDRRQFPLGTTQHNLLSLSSYCGSRWESESGSCRSSSSNIYKTHNKDIVMVVGENKITISFLDVIVSEGSYTSTLGTKRFTDVAIEASLTSKELYVGSHYKVKWKYVSKVECWEDGFFLRLFNQDKMMIDEGNNTVDQDDNDIAEGRDDGRSFEVKGPIHRRGSTASWQAFQRILQGRFQKEEKKRQRRIEEEREREEKKKREVRHSMIGRKRRPTYSKRPLDFMKRNAANISFNAASSSPSTAHFDFDSDGDDQVFQQYTSRKERDTNNLDSRKRNRPYEEEDVMGGNQSKNERKDDSEGEGNPNEGSNDGGATEIDNMDDTSGYNATAAASVDTSSDRDDTDHAKDKTVNYSDGDDTANDDIGLPKATKKSGRRLRRLKKRSPVLREDSDDDDDIFGGPGLTTPAVQRIVSPWTSTGKVSNQNPAAVDTVMEEAQATIPKMDGYVNESMAKEIDSDSTPSLEGEKSKKSPIDGPNMKISSRLKSKQSIASFFAPARQSENNQEENERVATKLKNNDPSNISSQNISKLHTEEDKQADNNENAGVSNDDIDESSGISESNHRDRSKIRENDPSLVGQKIMENSNKFVQSFFNPRPKRVNNSDFLISPPGVKEGDETDGNSTVVLNNTPTSGSHYSDIVETYDDDDDKSGRKPKKSSTPTSIANLSTPACLFSKNYDIVRQSAKKIEDDDPIDEIDSSQSPQPQPSSLWRSRGLAIQPRSRLGKTYSRSQNAFRALDFADAKTQLHGSPEIFTTERSPPMPACKSPDVQSPLMPKRIGLSSRNDDDVTKISSPVLETRPRWRGLRNNGNTCYINSSLQMLFSVPHFMRAIRGLQKDHRLVKNLVSLWNDLNDLQWKGAASARGLKDVMDDMTDRFHGFQQRDAHEFLGELIDMVHEELLDTEKKATHGGGNSAVDEIKKCPSTETLADSNSITVSNGREPTDDFFRLDVKVCLQCKCCGYSR
jgi:hypothetical protein